MQFNCQWRSTRLFNEEGFDNEKTFHVPARRACRGDGVAVGMLQHTDDQPDDDCPSHVTEQLFEFCYPVDVRLGDVVRLGDRVQFDGRCG